MPGDDDAPDLIPLDRAKLALNQATWSPPEEALLAEAIRVASDCARRWCHSPLVLGAFEVLYWMLPAEARTGVRVGILPARRVSRVATDPATGLLLSCATAGWVSVSTTTARLSLGTGPVLEFSLGGHATLASLATAMTAAAPGLVVTVVEPDANPSDLTCTGARLAIGPEPLALEVYRNRVTDWQFEPRNAVLRFSQGEGWDSLRVVVLAGYLPLPAAVEEAVAQWAAVFYRRMRGEASELPGDGSSPTDSIRLLLAPYRCYPLGAQQAAVENYPP